MHNLQASAQGPSTGELRRFWSSICGAGRDLFHDDMHVVSKVDGKVAYNFQYIDALFDAMLDLDVFWWKGNVNPPSDQAEWGNTIRATDEHWITRYGVDEVRSWYFEVWNEPNLRPFFAGSRAQYYELYGTTARTLKSIDALLRVGGPATSNFVPDTRVDDELEDKEVQKKLADHKDIDSPSWRPPWVENFLQWCHTRELLVDFVSSHSYPTDWALDTAGSMPKRVRELQATPKDLQLLRKIVSESPYPQAETHLTE